MLKLIDGTKREPCFTNAQLAEKHYDMAMPCLYSYAMTKDRWVLRKGVYNMVRYSIYRYHSIKLDGLTLGYESMFGILESAKYFLSTLTPRELMTDFPITKTYDGARYECADYFSTIEKFKNFDLDKPLEQQTTDVVEILWGYQNTQIAILLAALFCTVSKIQQANGGDDLFTGFCKAKGIEPPQTIKIYKNEKGKLYTIDNKGRSKPIHKNIPRYMRIIK